jgi:hypothetical protein
MLVDAADPVNSRSATWARGVTGQSVRRFEFQSSLSGPPAAACRNVKECAGMTSKRSAAGMRPSSTISFSPAMALGDDPPTHGGVANSAVDRRRDRTGTPTGALIGIAARGQPMAPCAWGRKVAVTLLGK